MPDELILFEKCNGRYLRFGVLFESTDMLYYHAFGFVKDNLVAEDIVQEVFIRSGTAEKFKDNGFCSRLSV